MPPELGGHSGSSAGCQLMVLPFGMSAIGGGGACPLARRFGAGEDQHCLTHNSRVKRLCDAQAGKTARRRSSVSLQELLTACHRQEAAAQSRVTHTFTAIRWTMAVSTSLMWYTRTGSFLPLNSPSPTGGIFVPRQLYDGCHKPPSIVIYITSKRKSTYARACFGQEVHRGL